MYEQARATKLLATRCIVCGRPLVDATSIETGMGPDCRAKYLVNAELSEDIREQANKLVYNASVAATNGHIETVNEISKQLEVLGCQVLAEKVSKRFKNAAKNASIEITEKDGNLVVYTPFRRGDKEAFIKAWRLIPGRRYENSRNIIPKSSKKALWDLLKEFFPNKFGVGPKGLFQVPAEEPTEKEMKQQEFDLR